MVEGAQVKKKTEYLIGDVTQMVGLSRDALCFYEKKGIINARKKGNGYRYYSEGDIYKLMYILYQGEMNTSLEEIRGFMNGRCSMESRGNHLRERMVEGEYNARMHQQIIIRLKLAEKDITRIKECLDRYSLRKFPSAYIMGSCEDLQRGLKEWFHLSSAVTGLDMTYFYNILTYVGRRLTVQGARLLLHKGLEPDLSGGFSAGRYLMTREKLCLYTVLGSGTPLPSFEMIQRMVQRDHKHGVETKGLVYANDVTSFFTEEGVIYCLEVYMPTRRILSQI